MFDYSEIEDDYAFEKFSEQLLRLMGYRILKSAGEGQDRGRDIVCSERLLRGGEFRWLVSCKHYSKKVGQSDDETRLDKLDEHGCDGFMYIYASGVTDSRLQSIEAVCNSRNRLYGRIEFDVITGHDITQIIINDPLLYPLVRQYMPASYRQLCNAIDGDYDCEYCNSQRDGKFAFTTKFKGDREPRTFIVGEECLRSHVDNAEENGLRWSYYTIEKPPW